MLNVEFEYIYIDTFVERTRGTTASPIGPFIFIYVYIDTYSRNDQVTHWSGININGKVIKPLTRGTTTSPIGPVLTLMENL